MNTQSGRLVIRNIGLLLSGRLEQPILAADCIIAEHGKISVIGKEKDLDTDGASRIIDAKGVTVAPKTTPRGTCRQPRPSRDRRLHPAPTTNSLDRFLPPCRRHHDDLRVRSAYARRPKDTVELKAITIASQRWYANFRPSGVKILAGAPVLEEGMEEGDFKDPADAA